MKNLNKQKIRRKARVRAKIFGTLARPRLSVFRSNKNMYAQLIDDASGKTLAAVHSKTLKAEKLNKTGIAKLLGEEIAKTAVKLSINQAVFDKGSYKYHGRVKAVCEAARSGGLKI